ncbi:unnamed protein product, partial [Rotaria socialis]
MTNDRTQLCTRPLRWKTSTVDDLSNEHTKAF